MGKYSDLAVGKHGTGKYGALAAQMGDVQILNKGMVKTVPAAAKLGPDMGIIGITPEHEETQLPPRKPERRNFGQRAAEAVSRVGEAFMEPWAQPNIFGSEEELAQQNVSGPLGALNVSGERAISGGLKLLNSITSTILQTGTESLSAVGLGPEESKGGPTEMRKHIEEVAAGFAPGEALAVGLIPRVKKVAAPALAPTQRNPLGTVYSLDDMVNGKLKADVELDRQARASLNILTPDKANIDSVVDNYKFWLDQVDPGHVLYPSTDGAVGEGIVGFRVKNGDDYVAAGQGTRKAGSADTPSSVTLYIPAKKAEALRQAQIVQAGKGNTSGLHYHASEGKLYFSIIAPDGTVIKGGPRQVQTSPKPMLGRTPVEVRTDIQGQIVQMGDEITQLHQNMLPSTRDKMVASFKDRAAAAKPGEMFPIVGSPGQVTAARTAGKQAIVEANRTTMKKTYKFFKEMIVDRSGAVRQALLKKAGPAGKDAEMKFALSAGAPGRASQRFEEAFDVIYGGVIQGRLPLEEKELVDDIIDSRRSMQIFSYKPDYQAPFGKGTADYEQNLRDIRSRVGEPKFLELNARADVYFDTMREKVSRLEAHGLLSADEATRLRNFEYSPREYIDLLDPTEVHQFGKSTMSVRSSGIQQLGKGDDLPLEMNSDTLLAETIARVEGRIMRNDANKALAAVARTPGNGIVSATRSADIGDRPVAVSYMEAGKKQTLWMNRDYAKGWLNYRPEWADTIGKWLGKASGANLLRTFATGINPVAGPFLFLMDAGNAMFLSHMYSGFVPKAAAQLGRDLWTVLPDALMRGPRYQQYAEEGGLMPFLVHGGRGKGIVSGPYAEKEWNALSSAMGYWNETFEVAMRLAIRERALKQGMSTAQAAYEARSWIDFSQGGHAAKFVDNIVPYLNAGIQGLRQIPRSFAKDPTKFALRMAQLGTGVTALHIYNRMRYPYVMDQIPEEEQARYFIFPSDQYTMDAQGQKRYLYGKVPVPPNLRWYKGAVDSILDMGFEGKKKPSAFMQGLKDSFSVFGDPTQLSVPYVRAAQEYVSNYDFYNQDNIWKGAEGIPPSEEYLALPNTPTADLAVDIGAATGLSPERLTKAFHDVIPRGLYTDAAAWAYRYAKTGEMLPEDAAYVEGPGADIFVARQYPFLSRAIGVTHPMANLYEQVQDVAEPMQGEAFALTRQLDTLSMRYLQAEGSAKRQAMSETKAFIEQAPDFARQRLAERFEATVVVDTAYQRFSIEDDMPPKKFWTSTAQLAPEARAEVFFEQWHGREGAAKRSMIALAKRMPGFWSNSFGVLFNRLRKERGSSPEAE